MSSLIIYFQAGRRTQENGLSLFNDIGCGKQRLSKRFHADGTERARRLPGRRTPLNARRPPGAWHSDFL